MNKCNECGTTWDAPVESCPHCQGSISPSAAASASGAGQASLMLEAGANERAIASAERMRAREPTGSPSAELGRSEPLTDTPRTLALNMRLGHSDDATAQRAFHDLAEQLERELVGARAAKIVAEDMLDELRGKRSATSSTKEKK